MRIHPVVWLTALGACSFQATCGGKKVKADDIEAKLKGDPTMLAGASKIDCPDGIKVEKGKTFDCQVELEGKTYPYVIKIDDVEGDKFHWSGDWKQPSIVAYKLRDATLPELERNFGPGVKITCPEPVIALPADRTVKCDVTSGDIKTQLIVEIDDALKIKATRLSDRFIDATKLVEILTPSVQAKLGPAVKVDCGSVKMIRRPDDGVLWCSISDGAKSAKIKVATDEALNVQRWEVVEPPKPAPISR